MKPSDCPACGTPAEAVFDPRERGGSMWAVCCASCGMMGSICDTEAEAVAAWSRFARAARVLAALDALPHSATLAYNRVSGVWVLSGAPDRRVGRTAVGALIGEDE